MGLQLRAQQKNDIAIDSWGFCTLQMSKVDYYIVDRICIVYNTGSEANGELRINRSKHPRSLGKLQSGVSVQEWIEENEELQTRIIYDAGQWNVKKWETIYYIDEAITFGLRMEDILRITRSIEYEIL
jgi:hypothetical protein